MGKITRSKWFQTLVHDSATPHSIAIGAAIGTFISILPTPGFNILSGLAVLLLYPRTNKLALFGAMGVWNPLTVTPLYYLSYKIGNWVFGSAPVVKYNVVLWDQLYNFSRRFLIGNLFLAIVVSVLTYFLLRYVFTSHRKKTLPQQKKPTRHNNK